MKAASPHQPKTTGSSLPSPRGHFIKRACTCHCQADTDRPCAECAPAHRMRRYRTGHSQAHGEAAVARSVVDEVLRSTGRPLDGKMRELMESRFGHDFSHVRIHTDAKAAKSAQTIDALAYTSGHDIVFGAGRYAPRTADGIRLLAHELAHVIQQAGSPTTAAILHEGAIASEDHPSEREADRVAARIAAGGNAHIAPGPGSPALQRQTAGGGQGTHDDDCSGWEQDPQSFSIHVARYVAKTEINPILGRSLPTTECQDDRQCDVTLEKGPTIRVLWNPGMRRALARFDSGGETKRYLYTYTCPSGQLTLKFLLTHHTPAASSSGPEEAG